MRPLLFPTPDQAALELLQHTADPAAAIEQPLRRFGRNIVSAPREHDQGFQLADRAERNRYMKYEFASPTPLRALRNVGGNGNRRSPHLRCQREHLGSGKHVSRVITQLGQGERFLPNAKILVPAASNGHARWVVHANGRANSAKRHHQPSTINHQPPTTNHQPPTTNHQPPTTLTPHTAPTHS